MITKKQYALHIVSKFALDNHIPYNTPSDLSGYIHMSSSLAVALEYLNCLNSDEQKYSSTRDGILVIAKPIDGLSEPSVLSVREIIDMLPNE